MARLTVVVFFFFNDTATTEIYTLSLHDALPISKPTAGILRLIVLSYLCPMLSHLPSPANIRGLPEILMPRMSSICMSLNASRKTL